MAILSLPAPAEADVIRLRLDTVVGGGLGGDLNGLAFASTPPITLPVDPTPGLDQQLNLTLTRHEPPVPPGTPFPKYVQLFVVQFSATPGGFVGGWNTANNFDVSPVDGSSEIYFSNDPANPYFLVSNQLQPTVVDLVGLGLPDVLYLKVTSVTRSRLQPPDATPPPGVTYAQDVFSQYPSWAYHVDAVLDDPVDPLGSGAVWVELIPEPATASVLLALTLGLRPPRMRGGTRRSAA